MVKMGKCGPSKGSPAESMHSNKSVAAALRWWSAKGLLVLFSAFSCLAVAGILLRDLYFTDAEWVHVHHPHQRSCSALCHFRGKINANWHLQKSVIFWANLVLSQTAYPNLLNENEDLFISCLLISFWYRVSSVVQSSFESLLFQPHPPECWHYRDLPQYPDGIYLRGRRVSCFFCPQLI